MPDDDLAQLKREAEEKERRAILLHHEGQHIWAKNLDLDAARLRGKIEGITIVAARLERAEAALLKAFELQRVCLDAMSARPGRFHNREGYTIRVALEEFSSARRALPEEPADAG